MTITEAVEPAAEGEDHGLAEHLAAIEDSYQVALAAGRRCGRLLDAVPPDSSAVAGPAIEELTAIVVKPPVLELVAV